MKTVLLQPVAHRIDVVFSGKKVALPEKIVYQIERNWELLIGNRPSLRRGVVFTVSKINMQNDQLQVVLDETDYAHYMFTLENELQEEYACKVLYTSAILETSDGFVSFGKMASHTSTPNRFQCVGGGLDFSDVDHGKFNILGNISKEIEEEVGLSVHTSQKVNAITPYLLKSGGDHNFLAVIFRVSLALTGDELRAHFRLYTEELLQRNERPEFSQLEIMRVTKNTICTFSTTHTCVDYLVPLLERMLLAV
ncbi:MAG: hypothetical protein WCT08_02125 [Patescibacteria group bacterium]|jgi:hypothetical protein